MPLAVAAEDHPGFVVNLGASMSPENELEKEAMLYYMGMCRLAGPAWEAFAGRHSDFL